MVYRAYLGEFYSPSSGVALDDILNDELTIFCEATSGMGVALGRPRSSGVLYPPTDSDYYNMADGIVFKLIVHPVKVNFFAYNMDNGEKIRAESNYNRAITGEKILWTTFSYQDTKFLEALEALNPNPVTIIQECIGIAELIRSNRNRQPDKTVSESVPNSMQSETAVIPANTSHKKNGGRPIQEKTKWIQRQFSQGLTPAEILDKWDGMSDSARKSIDNNNFQRFVSVNIKDNNKITNERKKATDSIEKKRPKKRDS